jgi:hypothetical protein
MVDVYYPYFEREAKWEELRYSLRSLRHLKVEHRVWIVGDLPAWIRPGTVNHIHRLRREGMKENATFDAISKLMAFIDHPDTSMWFIRMYDDILLVGDCTLDDISRFRAMYDHSKLPARDGVWWDQLRRTLQAVILKGYHGWNTETHLPEYFNKEWMRWVIDVYHASERRLLTSTLYFNTFYSGFTPQMWPDSRGIQFYNNQDNEFYSSSDGDLEQKCAGKLFLNYNNAGLTPSLQQFIMTRFPDKSIYEK